MINENGITKNNYDISKKISRENYLGLVNGDIVKCYFWHCEEKNETIEIISIRKRYGKQNGGHDYHGCLIDGINIKTGKRTQFDISFVTEVIYRNPIRFHMARNDYRDNEFVVKIIGNLWEGELTSLIKKALSTMPLSVEVDKKVHWSKSYSLYRKDKCPGNKRNKSYLILHYVVNKKVFKKWVRKNYLKLIYNSKELDYELTSEALQQEKENEDLY